MQRSCNYCGAEIQEADTFCTNCGAPTGNRPVQNPQGQSVPPRPAEPQRPHTAEGYCCPPPPHCPPVEPDRNLVSIGAYVGYTLLFAIPIVGLIVCIILAANCNNRSLKNYAIANLIIIGAGAVIAVFAFIIAVIVGAFFAAELAFAFAPILLL